MKIKLFVILILLIVGITGYFRLKNINELLDLSWWEVRSIDTVKYSRDLAREKKGSSDFTKVIDKQISLISETGASHVAVATPYDDEFLLFLNLWVDSAREHGLNVWFRGNLSGWEGWFDYSGISKNEHIEKTVRFIRSNRYLFQDGDIFDSCPECENGKLGDPRSDVDLQFYREFLIDEFNVASEEFESINKNVMIVYSMNGDVARLVMDKNTTKALGGVVTIDHYVKNSEQLIDDVEEIALASGGKVLLGEFGAPIPDIHGEMSEEGQAKWLKSAFTELINKDHLLGINYWTSIGGSTSLWKDNYTEKEVVQVVKKYYKSGFNILVRQLFRYLKI